MSCYFVAEDPAGEPENEDGRVGADFSAHGRQRRCGTCFFVREPTMDDNNGIGAMRMHETIVCAKMSADERGVNGENIACGKKSPRNGISETNGAFSQKPTVQTDSGGRLRFFKGWTCFRIFSNLAHFLRSVCPQTAS